MSNICLIKYVTLIRIFLWYFVFFACLLTRTLFIIQTWSKIFIFILFLNLAFALFNIFLHYRREYYDKLKVILTIFVPLLTIATLIVYAIYIYSIYYRVMNLVTINIMNNDRNASLLSNTLNHYQCCRIQEEILFDSVNERDYFLLFPFCEKSIEDNERKKDHWDNITTCGVVFRRIIFSIRFILIFDFLLNLFITIANLNYICEDNDEWIDNSSETDNINYKIK